MPYEEWDTETRKVEALMAIGHAVGELASKLATMVRETREQTVLLKRVETKLDQVMGAIDAGHHAGPSP